MEFVLDKNIIDFVKDFKDKNLEKYLKKALNGANKKVEGFAEHLEDFKKALNGLNKKEAEELFFSVLKYWLMEKSQLAKHCKRASHIGKFTHPDADQKSAVFFTGNKNVDGFLRTGNINTKLDFVSSATYARLTKFLSLPLKNQQNNSILEHLEKNSEYIQNQFSFLSETEYKNIRENLLKSTKTDDEITGSEIKQVYFPVDNSYHLLSILTPSGILLALKEKIKDMQISPESKKAKEAKKKAEQSETGFSDIYDLTLISYGGSNAQNISALLAPKLKNSYLLSSIPPQTHKKKIRLPKYDFFKDSLYIKGFKDIFHSFHKLQQADWNNQKIRTTRDNTIKFFLDQVVDSMWLLRKEELGWSASRNKLPLYQKKWLDNYYKSERESSAFDSNMDKVIDDIARNFIFSYEKALGKNKISLSDQMLKHIKNTIETNKESLR